MVLLLQIVLNQINISVDCNRIKTLPLDLNKQVEPKEQTSYFFLNQLRTESIGAKTETLICK